MTNESAFFVTTQPLSEKSSMVRSNTTLLFLITLAFFFISGTCGLLYQVVWTRKLVLLFGTTSYAVSTVLSIFFLGLGLGSLWGGRLADRSKRPLYLYGIFEIIIGIWAILFIVFIDAGESAALGLLKMVESSRGMGIALRAFMALGLLLLPVTLMGATLPLLSRFVTATGPVRGFRIGTLYSVNTFGAVLGCAFTGFVLIAALGYTYSTLVGAALNIVIGVMAIGLDRAGKFSFDPNDTVDDEQPESESEAPVSRRVAIWVLVAFACSGFCALGLEVLWTRLLTIIFLGTTYAFTTMLATVLCGIALGSAVASLRVDRIRNKVAAYGIIQVLTGASSIAMLAYFPHMPDLLSQAKVDAGFDWNKLVFTKFLLSFGALFIPTFLFGMSFPFVVKILTATQGHLGRDIGRLYSANTFGGVAGALISGFVLIPVMGTQWGIVALSLVLGFTGLILIAVQPGLAGSRKALRGGLGVAATAMAVMIMPADVSLTLNHWFIPKDHEIIYYREGVEGTVVVSSVQNETHGTDRVLWINAVQATASIEKGVKMNRFQGFLPLLFDRDINTALFMCFGSGITAGTLSQSPLERIDAVEISEDVLGAAHFFSADNFNVLENDNLYPIIDDGRNFLLTTDNKYDLITFEPMPLALAGVSTFYTKEYYELCRDHLTPGGLVSQWVPLHNGLTVDLVKDLVRTFVEVFPYATAWFINADLFLIGSQEPLAIDYGMIEQRLAENDVLRNGLADVYLKDIPELLACYLMGREELMKFTDGATVMTDDRPWAEFMAPKLIFERNVPPALEALTPHLESPVPLLTPLDRPDWDDIVAAVERRHRAHVQDLEGLKMYYGGMAFSKPEVHFFKSLEIDPNDYNAQYYISEVLLQRGRIFLGWGDQMDEVREILFTAREVAPYRSDVHHLLGEYFYEIGDLEHAAESYSEYLRLGGTDPVAQERSRQN